jgi:hypothetical protein
LIAAWEKLWSASKELVAVAVVKISSLSNKTRKNGSLFLHLFFARNSGFFWGFGIILHIT